MEALCSDCTVPYSRAWCVGERSEHIERLLNVYKYGRVKAASMPLVELLEANVPQLPDTVIVVPVPTVATHVRQRGYDHCELIAREFARRRGYRFASVIERIGKERQQGATRKQRIEQAKRAFRCRKDLKKGIYLLIDDVFTTGATVTCAAQKLLDAGAGEVWIAVVARQPID